MSNILLHQAVHELNRIWIKKSWVRKPMRKVAHYGVQVFLIWLEAHKISLISHIKDIEYEGAEEAIKSIEQHLKTLEKMKKGNISG